MLTTLDYNSVIYNQYHDVEKGKKRLDFFNTGFGKIVNTLFSPKSILKKVNSILTSQLVSSRGLLVSAKENCEQIQDKDTTKGIKGINRLLELNITILSLVDELIGDSQGVQFPELYMTKELVEETIENLYAVLRILKKANLKTPKETSDLAKDLSKVSVKSLEKAIYGR